MITESQYLKIAEENNIEVAAIKAVNEVEARGKATFKDGSLKILFEGHVFWRELKKKGIDPKDHVQGNEDILYEDWTSKHYQGGLAEYDRLKRAIEIDEEAAMRSCSWGAFQIMGFHAEKLGFEDVFDFVFFLQTGEFQNLQMFIKFCEVNNLLRHLRSKNWKAFARGYNGPGYAQNRYDIKLEAAYNRFKKK